MSEFSRNEVAAGRRFLLTCAMRRYKYDEGLNREELTDDVQRVVQLLCGDFLPAEVRYRHVDILGDSPTLVDFLDRLRSFCRSPDRRVDDYLVVYLAGHGEILDGGDHVVWASDTQPSDLLHSTIPTSKIMKQVLGETQVRRLLFLLDTCYSGKGVQDLAREALLRIKPPAAFGEETSLASGHGIILVAATRPHQCAKPGVFTTCLDRVARSPATAGHAVPTLRVGTLIKLIQDDPDKPPSQSLEWHSLGMNADEPAFLPNPRYRASLVDVDLLVQDQVSHAEQQARHLSERFLPATREFTGRHRALADLSAWLRDSATPSRACVVTGYAGSGKTALLGLIATMSDPDYSRGVPRRGLPSGFLVPDSAIAEAIDVGTLTTEQIRDRIATTAGLRVETTQELIDGLNQHTASAPIVVLVDALDEAADPHDLIIRLLNPLLQHCRVSVRLLLGTRPHLLEPKLLGKPNSGRYQLIDLDAETYADPDSIRDYARKILLSKDPLDSAYTPSGIYWTAPVGVLNGVTEAIGEAAGNSFLVARITAMTEATLTVLSDPTDLAWRASLPRRAGEAMRRDLEIRLRKNAAKAAHLLLPLAYSRGSGMPWEGIWPRLADALSPGHGYCNEDLVWLRKAAGSYAVEGVAEGHSVYRLYHQALVEHLREGRDETADQRIITDTLLAQVSVRAGGQRDWAAADPYTRTHLSTHAADAGRIDTLLTDPGFLLAASRSQLFNALDAAASMPGRLAAEAYRRAAHHLRSKPNREHAQYLQLAARCDRAIGLADALHAHCRTATWSVRWASWRYQPPHQTLTGHTAPVAAVAVTELDGYPVVISGSDDRTVRVWDLATGAPIGKPFTGHTDWVRAVAVAELNRRPVVISGSDDRTVRVWDLATGDPIGKPFTGHTAAVAAVAVAELDGHPMMISGGNDHTVRVWELSTGTPIDDPFTGHTGFVRAVAVAELDGRSVVISGSDDRTVRVWDLATGDPIGKPFTGHTGFVRAVAVAELDGRSVVISGSDDRTVRVWDLATGDPIGKPFTGHTAPVAAVAVTELNAHPVVISGSDDRTVRVWDLATGISIGKPFTGHTAPVAAVAVTELNGRPVVISGSRDATVRMWDLAKSQPMRSMLRAVRLRHSAHVLTAVVYSDHGHVYATTGCSDGTRRTWDLSTRRILSEKPASNGAAVNALALLGSDHVVFAAGSILVIGPTSQDSVDTLPIDLESKVLALATDSGSTVVAATTLGLVVLDAPGYKACRVPKVHHMF